MERETSCSTAPIPSSAASTEALTPQARRLSRLVEREAEVGHDGLDLIFFESAHATLPLAVSRPRREERLRMVGRTRAVCLVDTRDPGSRWSGSIRVWLDPFEGNCLFWPK